MHPPVIPVHPPVIPVHPPVIPVHPPVIPVHPPVIPVHPPVIPVHPPVIPAHPPVIPAHPPVIPVHPPVIPVHPPVIPAHPPVIPANAGIQSKSLPPEADFFPGSAEMGGKKPVFIAHKYPADSGLRGSHHHDRYSPGKLADHRSLLVRDDPRRLSRQNRSLLAVYMGAV